MRIVRRNAVLLGAATFIGLAACGADPTLPAGDGGTTPATPDGSWVLVAGSLDGDPLVLVEGWDVTLVVDGTDIGGTAACNGYGGTVTLGSETELGGSFTVGELSWTEMACEPAVMELERQFLTALQAIDSYELAPDLSLGVAGVGTALLFERLRPVPTAEVVGTTWVLDTYIAGGAATNVPGMEDATLTLHADGTLAGSTGCRELTGTWIETGPEILFIEFAAEGHCPPDRQQLDGWVVTVLGDGFTPVVDGRRLTVTAAGGAGLSYQAA